MRMLQAAVIVLLIIAGVVAVATLQDDANSEQTTTFSEYSQRLTTYTTWTIIDQYGTDTFGRVCGNAPWNDSISAHCGNVPIPEFPSALPSFLLVAIPAIGATIAAIIIRRVSTPIEGC